MIVLVKEANDWNLQEPTEIIEQGSPTVSK
jgi:hypothetical protein